MMMRKQSWPQTKLMKLETAIAKTSRKREDTRDPLKNYNKITFKKLCEINT